jgi:hypothetical protein
MADQPMPLFLADVIEADPASKAHHKKAAAELRRLHQFERGYNEWTEKTQWVQETKQTYELGMHRADVLKQRIEKLETVNQKLLEALKRIADPRNIHFAGDAQVVARAAIAKAEGAKT